MKKNYYFIDPAKLMGYSKWDSEGNFIESGYLELAKNRSFVDYTSSTCRKTKPNNLSNYEFNKNNGYCLIKQKKQIDHLNKKQYLNKLSNIITKSDMLQSNVYIEAPSIPTGAVEKRIIAMRVQFGIYAMFDKYLDSYTEINTERWFTFVTEEFPELVIWTNGKTKKTINRKATSKAIASQLIGYNIKDDNEADSINLGYYYLKGVIKIINEFRKLY